MRKMIAKSDHRVEIAMVLLFLPTLVTTATILATVTPTVDAGQGAPPELLNDFTTRHRVAIGTKLFKLTCPVRTQPGEVVMIQWKKDGEQIDPDWSRYKLGRSDRELRIRAVQATDSGRYTCEAVNGFGHKHVDFTLHAYGPHDDISSFDDHFELTDEETPPQWINEDEMHNTIASVIRIRPGEKAELRCPAKGNPRPRIRWTKNGTPFRRDPSPMADFSSAIRFPSSHVDDSGIYVCRVENDHGAIEARFDLRVTNALTNAVEEPIIDEPLNTTVRRGQTAQFQCKVRSSQPPLIRWLKRVDPSTLHAENAAVASQVVNAAGMTLLVLEADERSSQTVHSGLDAQLYTNRLVIPNAAQRHDGVYICVVTNPAGHIAYRAAHLTVLEDSRFSLFPAHNVLLWIAAIVALFVLIVAVSAICFLRRRSGSDDGEPQKQNNNKSNCSTTSANCQLIPPPPKMLPPQLPPFKSPSPYPPYPTSYSSTKNNRVNKLPTVSNRDYQARTLPRSGVGGACEESNHLYEASSPMPPYWHGAMLETDYDSDVNFPTGRLQPYPSMYSCTPPDSGYARR